MDNLDSMLAQISLEGSWQGREAKVFHLMGKRAGFVNTSAYHDIAEYLNVTSSLTFTELAGTENFEIISSSAQDGVGGTGVRNANIVYINSSYAIATTSVTMNGTTAVQLGVLGARMFLWAETGNSVGSSGVAVGNIDIRLTGAGAIHERITAGGNKSLSCRFMVPDGFECLVPSWDKGAINADMDMRFRATVNSIDRSLCTVYRFQDNAYLATNNREDSSLHMLKFPARSKLKVSTIPSSTGGTVRCDASFPVILIAG